MPDGLRLVFLPPYSPELQSVEHLWQPLDEVVVNKHFASLAELDAAPAQRCVVLTKNRKAIQSPTLFNWWPAAVVN